MEWGRANRNKPLTSNFRKLITLIRISRRGDSPKKPRKTFGVGFFPGKGSMHDRIVIPIHNREGELVAYAGRSIDGSEPRYKFPAGFHKGQVLYHLDRVGEIADTVIVVEGFFGCMKLVQAGFPNTVALMGSSLTEVQHKMLFGFKNIVLFLDGDEAGRNATKEIVAKLVCSNFVRIAPLVEDLQPDGMTSEGIRNILNPLI